MSSTTNSKVSVRLFVGTLLHAELKANLQHSPSWREVNITSVPTSPLIAVWFQGKEYFGRYLSEPEHSLMQLQQESKNIQKELEQHCPNMKIEALPILIFPQIFIS